MNAMSKSTKSGGSGCGCGGAGAKSGGCGCGCGAQAALCACGGVGCTTCRNQGFVRPRFFAGQLLTEEDLQKLIDYVVAKNRLHNRRLWGDGVVCGLEVSCNPCGGGTVVVDPGYALDCCGNDLVLGCPQSLDIVAMIRDLKRSLRGGYDCGDPCPPKEEKPKDQQANQTNVDLSIYGLGKSEPPDDQKEPMIDTTRHYCLYIRYCENETEPVSPYATDEGCSYQSCQPTRVNEGVSFELRCSEDCGHPKDIRDRICDCLGDATSVFQNTNTANEMQIIARYSEPIVRPTFAQSASAAEEEREAALSLIKSAESLRNISFAKQQPSVGKAKSKVAPQKVVTPAAQPPAAQPPAAQPPAAQPIDTAVASEPTVSLEGFENALGEIRTTAANLANFYLARDKTRAAQAKPAKDTPDDKDIEAAKKELRRATSEALSQVEATPASEQERAYYSSLLKATADFAATDEPLRDIGTPGVMKISQGQIIKYSDLNNTSLAALREEILDRLDRSPRNGDCKLYEDVLAIRVPDANATGNDWYKAAIALSRAWVRYVKECLCSAMNPPCGPCDDPAVLLACIVVRDCEVISICNLKRKFVLAPTSLRYWVPQLNELGEELERLCCPETICPDDTITPTKQRTAVGLGGVYGSTILPARLNPLLFLRLCGLKGKGITVPSNYATSYANRKDIINSTFRAATATPASPFEQLVSVVDPASRPSPFAIIPVTSNLLSADMIAETFRDRAARESLIGALKPELDRLTALNASEKAKLKTAMMNQRELKQVKNENAELRKNYALLDERLKKVEGP